MNFNAHEYDLAMEALVEQVQDGHHMADPLLQLFPPVRSEHLGPMQYVSKEGALTQPMETLPFAAAGVVSVKTGDLDGLATLLHDLANARTEAMVRQWFEKIGVVTEFFGNHIENDSAAGFSIDAFLQCVERLGVTFGNKFRVPDIAIVIHQNAPEKQMFVMAGESVIVIVMHPSRQDAVAEAEWTDSQKARFKQILRSKWEQQRAESRTRRLS